MFITEEDYIQVGPDALKIMQQSSTDNRKTAEQRAMSRIAAHSHIILNSLNPHSSSKCYNPDFLYYVFVKNFYFLSCPILIFSHLFLMFYYINNRVLFYHWFTSFRLSVELCLYDLSDIGPPVYIVFFGNEHKLIYELRFL